MDGTVVRVTLVLIVPAVLFVFGLAFAGAWLFDRRRRYFLHLAAACGCFTLGACSQILGWPPGVGPNALVSGALYTGALLLTMQGLLSRSGRPGSWQAGAAILAIFTALLAYYFYVDRNLLARVYIQNFGYGLLLLGTALRLRHLAHGRVTDRILFWVLLLFALQFFPRTLLTIGFSAPADARAFAHSAFWQTLQLSLAVLGTSLALAMLAACVSDIIEDLRRERDTDGLTGVLNRRAFQERVARCLQDAAGGVPGSLILCDLDHFKPINDTYGHDAGDTVLREVAETLARSVRPGDTVGRLGGEEFGVFAPGLQAAQAAALAARLKDGIAAQGFEPAVPAVRLSASFGVSPTRPGDTWETLYRRTDALLYRAKRLGRNRVVAEEAPGRGLSLAAGGSRMAD